MEQFEALEKKCENTIHFEKNCMTWLTSDFWMQKNIWFQPFFDLFSQIMDQKNGWSQKRC